MSKTGKRESEGYSWRPGSKLRQQLEAAARTDSTSVDSLVERAVREWLARLRPAKTGGAPGFSEGDGAPPPLAYAEAPRKDRASQGVSRSRRSARQRNAVSEEDDTEQQRRLRERVMKAVGTISIDLGGSATNARVREAMGKILEKKYRASQRRAPKRAR